MAKPSRKLSDQLRDCVLSCGVTRYKISKATGVDAAVLLRFVNKGAWISVDTFDRLAVYFGWELKINPPKKKGK
jgi:plasmid maintenance system antidote protein VapI